MMVDRELLRTYLRQRLELGERELFLDGMSGADAIRLLRARQPATGSVTGERGPTTGAGPAPGDRLRPAVAGE
ncbi:MAG TPA: hypothetical protein VJ957_08450, partial [Longimicrobiales bacterium]|nr:hypothetical protein [Longimicrobiales bacterium]